MLNERQMRRNQRAIRHALAQQALEGLTVPLATVSDLERVARGEMTISDALRNAHARFANGQVLQP
jgi:hypothetical protein